MVKAEIVWHKSMIEESWSPHGGKETERERQSLEQEYNLPGRAPVPCF